jgi:hypothetical protein
MAISYVAGLQGTATSGGTFNISRPTGSAQDDIIIGLVSCASSSAIGAYTWPSGWTVLNTHTHTNDPATAASRLEVAWHKYVSGETNYSMTVPSLSSGSRVHMTFAYRGLDTTTPFIQNSIGTADGASSSSAITSPTATSSVANVWGIAVIHAFGSSLNFSWTPSSGTERGDLNQTTATYRAGQQLIDSNGTIDASGGVSYTSTPNNSVYNRLGWVALMQPPVSAGTSYQSCGILLG